MRVAGFVGSESFPGRGMGARGLTWGAVRFCSMIWIPRKARKSRGRCLSIRECLLRCDGSVLIPFFTRNLLKHISGVRRGHTFTHLVR